MTHLRHDVTLTAPPREWADAVLDAVVAEIEAARFDDELRLAEPGLAAADVRITQGPHLAPGARYSAGTDGDEITVHEWSPRTRIAFSVADERPTATASTAVEVLPGARSRIATLSGLLQVAGPFPKLRRLSWDGRVDLDRWWAGQPAAIEATVEHRWARAKVTAQATTVGERWTVRCEAQGRGRSWGRLMAAVVLLIWHGALVREFRKSLDEVAKGWDETLAHWQDAPPHDAA
ncbi:MAG TPA: hypothetical protein VH479_08740, partial [Acidimicrobiales bacterium]